MTNAEIKKALSDSISWAGKLVVFLLIPGLNLFLRGWQKCGGLLMLVAVAGTLPPVFLLQEKTAFSYYSFLYTEFFLSLAIVISGLFLCFDLKGLNRHKVRLPALLFLPIAAWACLYILTPRNVSYVETKHLMCPTLCHLDVAYLEEVDTDDPYVLDIHRDDVIIYLDGERQVSGRLLAWAGDTVCIESEVDASIKSPDNPAYCQRELLLGDYELYVVHDGPEDPLYSLMHHSGVVHIDDLVAARPLVVTNIYFFAAFVRDIVYEFQEIFPEALPMVQKLFAPKAN